MNSINIIFGASIDLVPVSEEALALHLQVSGFPKSTVREALIIEEVSKRGLAPFSDGVIEQMTGQPPRSIEAVLVEHRLDLLLSTSTPGFERLYAVLCGTARLHFAEAGVNG